MRFFSGRKNKRIPIPAGPESKISVLRCALLIFLAVTAHLQGQSNLLHPGDGVRLTAYNVPGITSGDYFIQENGELPLPYIGQIPAANRSFPTVKQIILEKYQKIYREPEISLHPLIRIRVLGEVRKPGIYYVTGVDRLTDVLAMAGGETNTANMKMVRLIRTDQVVSINLKKQLEKEPRIGDLGLSSGDQIYLPKRRWVNFRSVSVMISAAALLLSTLEVLRRN